ncbi:MAG: hypothetical protein ACI37R_04550 [Candidatus Avigastranaerophilus sp.]
MYKNFSVIIFILVIIYIIFSELYGDSVYKLPSKIAIDVYDNFIPPLICSIILDISKRIFKNKIAQRIILALNILALGYTILLLLLYLGMDLTSDTIPKDAIYQDWTDELYKDYIKN